MTKMPTLAELLKEETLDDRFNKQMHNIQNAIEWLGVIIVDMKKPGAGAPTATQVMQLKHAYEDLLALHDEVK
jgi:hypothetical protein